MGISTGNALRSDLKRKFKEEMGHSLLEIYVHTTEERGREHWHAKDYEPPLENFVDIDTTEDTVKQSVDKIIRREKI